MQNLSRLYISFFLTYVVIIPKALATLNDVNLLETCPPKSAISPCTCHRNLTTLLSIRCSGPTVTQETVNRVSSALWKTSKSNMSDRIYLYFGKFIIQDTLLEEFDLLPFTAKRISWFENSNNPKLSNIIFSGNSSNPDNLIKIAHLHLENNSLADAGLAQVFLPLHPDELWTVHLGHNLIVGSEGSGEFIKGLSAFKGVVRLNLTHNKISRVVGGQFKDIQILDDLILDQNPIIEVGDDAFLLNDTKPRDYEIEVKKIHLIDCGLNDSKFSGRTGIERNKNKTAIKLFLWANDFDTVSEDKFGPFLAANPKNQVEFEKPPIAPNCKPRPRRKDWNKCKEFGKNPIICDEKLKWLKTWSFLSQVGNLTCKNDPGQTIYTSKLV